MGITNKKGSNFNLGRKLIHSAGLFFAVGYYFNIFDIPGLLIFKENTRSILFYLITLGYILMLIMEFLRTRVEWVKHLVIKVLGPILKDIEINGHLSSSPFFLGMGLAIGFFPKEFAICAIFFLSFGDPAAAWFGQRYGKIRLANNKSIEGMLSGATFSFLTASGFILLHDYFNPANTLWSSTAFSISLLGVIFGGALAAFFAELFAKNGFFDDNLVIPVTGVVSLTFLYAIVFHVPLDHLLYSFSDLIFPAHT